MSKNHGSFFLAGLLGALAGAVGGLLLAPKSGKATRKDIVKLANEISKKVKTETVETKKRVEEIYGKVTDEAQGAGRGLEAFRVRGSGGGAYAGREYITLQTLVRSATVAALIVLAAAAWSIVINNTSN